MIDLEKIRQMLDEEEYPSVFDPEEWRACQYANCYVYALRLKLNASKLIGDFIGHRVTCSDSIDTQIAVLFKELEMLGFMAEECEPTDLVDDETTIKIYIEWDKNRQYHFYRQDEDGRWSHKAREFAPKNVNQFGEIIYNPEDEDIYCGMCLALTRF